MMMPMGPSGATVTMEHPEDDIAVPALVDDQVLSRFCKAVQGCADGLGLHDEAASQIRLLQSRLANLRGLASLCRLAIVGHPRSFARVVDEMYCLSVDFPCDPLEDLGEGEANEDEPDDRVILSAAVDLFAGASFVSKDKPRQRDVFIIGLVRAIEDAIAFPVTFSSEAATWLGEGDGTLSPLHAGIVIANATQRLIEGDLKCVPKAPLEIRRRLECIARKWMRKNPVDEFFAAISGPRVYRIVHWEDPQRVQPDDARVGDRVTLLVRERGRKEGEALDEMCGSDNLKGFGVMFCPHAPAPVVRIVDDGLQVLVPENSRTGPIAIVNKSPDFTVAKSLIADYADQFPEEWNSSIFASVRMDTWAYPDAFGPPILEIMPSTKQGGDGNQPSNPPGVPPKIPAPPGTPTVPNPAAGPGTPSGTTTVPNPAVGLGVTPGTTTVPNPAAGPGNTPGTPTVTTHPLGVTLCVMPGVTVCVMPGATPGPTGSTNQPAGVLP